MRWFKCKFKPSKNKLHQEQDAACRCPKLQIITNKYHWFNAKTMQFGIGLIQLQLHDRCFRFFSQVIVLQISSGNQNWSRQNSMIRCYWLYLGSWLALCSRPPVQEHCDKTSDILSCPVKILRFLAQASVDKLVKLHCSLFNLLIYSTC